MSKRKRVQARTKPSSRPATPKAPNHPEPSGDAARAPARPVREPSRETTSQRWPGACPKCGAERLVCYARATSTGMERRTKYWRCAMRCGYRTSTEEKITGNATA